MMTSLHMARMPELTSLLPLVMCALGFASCQRGSKLP